MFEPYYAFWRYSGQGVGVRYYHVIVGSPPHDGEVTMFIGASQFRVPLASLVGLDEDIL